MIRSTERVPHCIDEWAALVNLAAQPGADLDLATYCAHAGGTMLFSVAACKTQRASTRPRPLRLVPHGVVMAPKREAKRHGYSQQFNPKKKQKVHPQGQPHKPWPA
jgi:hypothetical protein